MGGAAMVGLGLARAQPKRRVLVITGDGEMLMGLGSLATIAVDAPKNLAIAVIDNGHYGETGMQRAHTGRGVDITGMAKAAGFKSAATITTQAALKLWIKKFHQQPGPVFGDIKVSAVAAPMALPVRDGTAIKHRFRTALLGADALK
jgi:thiamine pyrophosphate-dependent acetolactate synthase large subunit-like protein